ncbi:hypothetical protein CDG79_28750 [Nostoc sp. 'Peltigera membranacea cyanobiont' 232]|nr:hypothetical protein CDG79_28750 [Nostoc sp. 'Peltigera membranacea cyanobiont' 232]
MWGGHPRPEIQGTGKMPIPQICNAQKTYEKNQGLAKDIKPMNQGEFIHEFANKVAQCYKKD